METLQNLNTLRKKINHNGDLASTHRKHPGMDLELMQT